MYDMFRCNALKFEATKAKANYLNFDLPLLLVSVDRTTRIMTVYWHDNVVCLSVRPSVCDAMHCG